MSTEMQRVWELARQAPDIALSGRVAGTSKQLCEVIEKWLVDRHNICGVTARAIWEMSPTGELWPVFALFNAAFADGYRIAGQA